MTIRLYLDEDLRGVEVLGAQECGMRGQSDDEQLRWAAGQQRVLYSSNRGDFYRLHSEIVTRGEGHSGIILGPQQRYSVGEQLYRLLRLIDSLSAEQMQNRVEFLSAWH
jgi:hypothetical protein